MSSPSNAITPILFPVVAPTAFTVTNSTTAKVVVDLYPEAAASGNTPAKYGGCSVIDLIATSTDVAKDVIVWTGTVLTTVDAGSGTGTTTSTATTNATLVRTNGSWITDGWRVGDLAMCFAAATPGAAFAAQTVEGTIGILTGVTSTTLTFSGVPTNWTAITLTTGTRICRMAYRSRVTVAATAGTDASTAGTNLIGSARDGSILRSEIKLGPNNILAVAMQAAVGALPAYVSITPTIAMY